MLSGDVLESVDAPVPTVGSSIRAALSMSRAFKPVATVSAIPTPIQSSAGWLERLVNGRILTSAGGCESANSCDVAIRDVACEVKRPQRSSDTESRCEAAEVMSADHCNGRLSRHVSEECPL